MISRFGLGALAAVSVLTLLSGCAPAAEQSGSGDESLTTLERKVTKLVAGIDYTCLVRSDRTLACVGHRMAGAPEGAVSELSGGTRHACALMAAPALRSGVEAAPAICWGDNSYGQSATPTHPLPEDAPAAGDSPEEAPKPAPFLFSHIAAGTLHTCGILAEAVTIPGTPASESPPTPATPDVAYVAGAAYCWGGDDDAIKSPPDLVLGQIAASQDHTCGIKADNTLECWGAETDGAQPASILANKPAGQFRQIAMSYEHACALKTDGAAVCWGGANRFEENNAPGDVKFTQLAVGRYFACGLVAEGESAGTTKCWGLGDEGRTAPPPDKFVEIVAGESHACGLLANEHTLKCWGLNDYGEAPASVDLVAPPPPPPARDAR